MGRLLETSDLSKSFGGIKAVQNFLIHIDEGEVIGLIGPNGAGKTTAFNLLTGVYTPTTGRSCLTARTSPAASPIRSRRWASPAPSRTSASSASSPFWKT